MSIREQHGEENSPRQYYDQYHPTSVDGSDRASTWVKTVAHNNESILRVTKTIGLHALLYALHQQFQRQNLNGREKYTQP